MIKAAVFDLDGTLLNTVPALKKSMNLALAELGFGSITEEEVKRFVGNGSVKFTERALKRFGCEDEETLKRGIACYGAHFSVHCGYELKPYEGIPEALAFLKEKGVRLAVLSNKPQAQVENNIYGCFGREIFDAVFGEGEGIPLKPDPRGLERVLKILNSSPEETLYFGDTATDMQTGTGAGLMTAGVLWGFRGREELEPWHPAAILDAPTEIPAFYEAACRNGEG